jgi:hypothetical protein
VKLSVSEFVLANVCDCCGKPIPAQTEAVGICHFNSGVVDTSCLACWFDVIASSIAWATFEGNLGPESAESRLARARTLAKAQIAARALADTIFEN